MFLINRLNILFIIILILFLSIENTKSLENRILLKVNEEIITTIDIYEEIKFLKLFNSEISNLSETELFEVSKNSILRNKIKKIEIMNFVEELKVEDKFLFNLIKNKYSKMGINSLESFEEYLKNNNLDIKIIKEKFTIELIWNDLIFQKFSNKIILDKEKIKNEILQNPKRGFQRELLISEIVFDVDNTDDFKNKYEKILSDIEKIGFKKTALIHSNSDTASNGGLIGWIKEDNLNLSIKKVISRLQSGQFSKPVRTSTGFLIVKIDDEKDSILEFNLENKMKEIIKYKTNEQLNQFSRMYFNKIKKDLIIYDL